MKCPECKSELIKEAQNLYTLWRCPRCGFRGVGDEFDPQYLDPTPEGAKDYDTGADAPWEG